MLRMWAQTGTRPYATARVQCSLAPCGRLGRCAEAHELEERIAETWKACLQMAGNEGISMNWVTQSLGKICDKVGGIIRTGPFGSQLHESDYRNEGTPVIMPKNIVEGKVSVDGIARIGDEDVARLSQHILKKGEIVYGRRGDIGRRALITERESGWLCGTGCLRISLGDSVLDPLFLFYYLGQPDVVTWIAQQAVGATLLNLNTGIIRSIRVTYPPLPIQRKIAGILSAYDDLIENNTRRIRILEEMARTIYREWFVEFRAPGVKLRPATPEEKKVIGKDVFPTGWELKTLGDIAQEVRRSVQPDEIDAETPYFGLEHLPRKSIALSEWGNASDVKSTKLAFKKGEILFGKIRPYFHKVGVAPVDGVCSSDTIVIVPKSHVYFALVLACVSSEEFVNHATQTSQGTKMPRANWDVLVKYPVTVPPQPQLDQFNALVRDKVDLIQNMVSRNRNLRRTRDLLLPRLVSGELDVEHVEVRMAG
jgi:type I restriction enzyme S subunit